MDDDDDDGLDLKKEADSLGLDMNTVDAETLIYTAFEDKALDRFEKYPAKTQEKIISGVNKILENARTGKKSGDYNMGIMENLKKLTGGGETVLSAINHFLKFLPNIF